jgi:hypothetical protein
LIGMDQGHGNSLKPISKKFSKNLHSATKQEIGLKSRTVAASSFLGTRVIRQPGEIDHIDHRNHF